ncbi:MAG: protein tyrosine phosphatase family protein [Pseudomonadota bacterium]|nr:protein tyrosine phosphatase family protein [Pseudomonadota bacterium]
MTTEHPLAQIINVRMIHTNLYSSGQPTLAQLVQIREAGFNNVINLALQDASNALAHEDRWVLEQGMDYYHFPLLWEQPSVTQGLFILDAIHHLRDQPTWLHCALNYRGACVIYLYERFYLGLDLPSAKERLEQVWQPDETWTGWMFAVEQQLTAGTTVSI